MNFVKKNQISSGKLDVEILSKNSGFPKKCKNKKFSLFSAPSLRSASSRFGKRIVFVAFQKSSFQILSLLLSSLFFSFLFFSLSPLSFWENVFLNFAFLKIKCIRLKCMFLNFAFFKNKRSLPFRRKISERGGLT